MRRNSARAFAAVSMLLLAPHTSAAQEGQPEGQPLPPADIDVAAYIDSAVAVLRTHAIRADTIDWDAFRDSVHAWAAPAEELADAHLALSFAARRINRHSFLNPPQQAMMRMVRRMQERAAASQASRATPRPTVMPTVASPFSRRRTPTGTLHERDGRLVAQIAIPAFGREHSTAFADSIQAFVREFDAAGACGWIVDLRGNGGGNMWPMVAGIGPLLGAGDTIGWFEYWNRPPQRWYYLDGTAGFVSDSGPAPLGRVSGAPHRIDGTPPVAVLFDAGTASSGEATAIAFMGRPNTRTFGQRSAGLATANDMFELPDGAMLVVTVGYEADRTGAAHREDLVPDELVPIVPPEQPIPATPPSPDPQLEAALDWLTRAPGCAG